MLEQGLITFSGENVADFLQGQLTCDVNTVTPEKDSLGAYCNPQGRVIATFRIFLRDDQFYLQLPKDNIQNTLQTLRKYAVFSKIDVQPESLDKKLNLAEQINAGIPHITAATSEKFTPHMLNLPQLNAVSFNKGCYVGQEVVARTEHLGTVKRKLYKASIDSNETPIPSDTLVDSNKTDVGMIINACNSKLLAVIKTNAVKNDVFWQATQGHPHLLSFF